MPYNVFCVFIKVDYLAVHGIVNVNKETETPSLQHANAGSLGLYGDVEPWKGT